MSILKKAESVDDVREMIAHQVADLDKTIQARRSEFSSLKEDEPDLFQDVKDSLISNVITLNARRNELLKLAARIDGEFTVLEIAAQDIQRNFEESFGKQSKS